MPRQSAAQKAAEAKAAQSVEKPAGEGQPTGDATSTPAASPAPASTPAESTPAQPAAPAAPKETKTTTKAKKKFIVVGAVAVLPTTDKSERYVYRNAPVDPDAFTPEGIKHAVSLGLVAEVK